MGCAGQESPSMKHGIISKSGRIICDPIPYSADRFADIITRHGGNPAAIPKTTPTEPVDCGPLQILPSEEIRTPAPNKHAYQQRFTAWAVVGDKLQRETEWHLLPDDQIRLNLIEAIAAIRWEKETGGITLTNGISVKTDRESQGTIFNGYSSLKNGLVASSMWKFAGEWVEVTLPDIEPIAQAVSRHVRACFSAEKAVSDLIDKATDTNALLAIDLQHEFTQALSNV